MGIFDKTAPDGTERVSAFNSSLKKERKEILKTALMAFGLIMVVLALFQSLYFGAYYRQEQNAYRLTIRVLDLDSQYASTVAGAQAAVLGPAVQTAIQQNIATYPDYHLGWQIADSQEISQFQIVENGQGLNASQYARELVNEQTVFGVIIINPNATRLAFEAISQGQTSYDNRGAMTFYYEEARNFYTENQYVAFLSTKLMDAAIGTAATNFAQRVLQSGQSLATASSGSNALTQPFGYSLFNLHPFDQLGAEGPSTASAIYLVISTKYNYSKNTVLITPFWHMAFGPLRSKISKGSEITLALIVPFIAYFWISLMYSLFTIAFRVSFTRKYGHVGFFIYWLLNWCCMTGLGFTMDFVFTLLGIAYFAFFLVAFVIINVSVVFLDIADMDHLYSYGFAFPVWNSVDGTKSIIFGTKNHLLQNFAVCIGWVIVGAGALAILTIWKRKQRIREEVAKKSK